MSQPEDQLEREVQEALRVQAMTPQERRHWLRTHWDRLQANMDALYAGAPQNDHGAISFETLDAKNAYDEQRELEFALKHAPALRVRR